MSITKVVCEAVGTMPIMIIAQGPISATNVTTPQQLPITPGWGMGWSKWDKVACPGHNTLAPVGLELATSRALYPLDHMCYSLDHMNTSYLQVINIWANWLCDYWPTDHLINQFQSSILIDRFFQDTLENKQLQPNNYLRQYAI
jgi:hypothetical protein